jgi:hypothetical protein
MFIDLNHTQIPIRSEERDRLWLYDSRTIPLLRTEPEGLLAPWSINMSPLTG